MAHDLLFRNFPAITRQNWARDCVRTAPAAPAPAAVPADVKITPTPEERARLEKLAKVRMRAESGDKKARKQWGQILSQVATLKKNPPRDARQARAYRLLLTSGLLDPAQKITVQGEEQFFPTPAKEGSEQFFPSPAKEGSEQFFAGDDSGAEEILGEFVGDEERLAQDAGPAEQEASSRIGSVFSRMARTARRGQRRKRGRQFRNLTWRASRGDAQAASRLQQIKARLQQRASAGDTRASSFLQRIQSAAATQAATPYAAPYVAPPATPAPTANVYYTAPGASNYDYDAEYDEEY